MAKQETTRQADKPLKFCGDCWTTTDSPLRPDCPHHFDLLAASRAIMALVGPVLPPSAKPTATTKTATGKKPVKKPAARQAASKERPVKKRREELQLELFS